MKRKTIFLGFLLVSMGAVLASETEMNTTNQRYGTVPNGDTVCGSLLCRNGGRCIWTGMNNYRCQCDSVGYWLGIDCSIANPCIWTPCNGRGQCYFLPDATYYCICSANYTGSNCQFMITSSTTDPCVTTRPCLNGGTCIPTTDPSQYKCQCPPNYAGEKCQWINSISTTASTTTSSPLSCGLSPTKAPVDFDRIINGQSVYTYTWPWLVSLQTISSGSHFCGGTLVDPLHVITAAHCFDTIGNVPSQLKVVAGVLNLQQTSNVNVQQLAVDRIFRHEQYSTSTLKHDIAVIKLRTPAKITSTVYPICLPSTDGKQDPKTGQSVQIAGWGYTNSATKQLASQLQQATIQVLDINDDLYGRPGCSAWIRRGYPVTANQQICAMSRDTRTDSCQGDSGGPLIRDLSSRWYLFGIVSYGDPVCASSTAAGVYTRVSAYMPWIQQKLKL